MRRLALVACLLPSLVLAQAPSGWHGTASLNFENDAFGKTDRFYSNGVQAAWRSTAGAALPAPLDWLDRSLGGALGPGTPQWGLSLGQTIFTPRDTRLREPDRRDRPYAGQLFAAIGLNRVAEGQLTSLELQLGILGPASLGRQVQDIAHDVLGDRRPRGWRRQLHDEPVLNLLAERRWRLPLGEFGGIEAEALPTAGLALGNGIHSRRAGRHVPHRPGPLRRFRPHPHPPRAIRRHRAAPHKPRMGLVSLRRHRSPRHRPRHHAGRQQLARQPQRAQPPAGRRCAIWRRATLARLAPRLHPCAALRGILWPARRRAAIRQHQSRFPVLTRGNDEARPAFNTHREGPHMFRIALLTTLLLAAPAFAQPVRLGAGSTDRAPPLGLARHPLLRRRERLFRSQQFRPELHQRPAGELAQPQRRSCRSPLAWLDSRLEPMAWAGRCPLGPVRRPDHLHAARHPRPHPRPDRPALFRQPLRRHLAQPRQRTHPDRARAPGRRRRPLCLRPPGAEQFPPRHPRPALLWLGLPAA